jgi:4-amino-4-deoxy-L-arabinose transferase-like glycosyltransferase
MTDRVFKKHSSLILIGLILLLGLFLRWYWWPQYVTFGFEQARDALAAKSIFTERKLTLIGPTTEVEGLFHGPIYYYLIGLVYFLFGPNPSSVSLMHILFNLASIPVIYVVGKKLFGPRVGLLAAAFFAVSYEVISYSLWLSNPSPALAFIILAYYFFYKSFKENQKYLPLAAFLFAIAVSFDLIIIMHLFGVVVLYFVYNQKKIPLRTWAISLATLILPLINYPLFEIRHQFLMANTFLKLLQGQDSQLKSIFQYLSVYFDGLAEEFANLFFPIHGFFAGLLMLALFIFLWRKLRSQPLSKSPWAFIAIFLFANLPTFLIIAAVTNSEFSYFGVNAAAALLLAAFIDQLLAAKKKWLAISLMALIFLGSLRAWQNYFPNPQRKLFDSQRGVILKDTLAAVDYTYQEANGKPFFVDSVTVPLFISPLWNYLYSWHGQEKFGYLPTKDTSVNIQFLIIEPGWGQTFEIFRQKAVSHLNQTTRAVETKKFGAITVERRLLQDNEK